MSQSRRGGRWGMNFISPSGPQASLSMNSLQAAEAAAKALQERAETPNTHSSGTFISHGGRKAYAPPPSFMAPPLPQNKFESSHSVGQTNYSSLSTGSRAFTNLGKRRMRDDDDYFNEEEDSGELEYQPAPGSPGGQRNEEQEDSDSSVSDDPLDKFMEGIEQQVQEITKVEKAISKKDQAKGVRDDIEQEDEIESYLRFMEENPNIGIQGDDEEIYEYDSEGNIIATEKKVIDPLPPIDHSVINYAPFTKSFYSEHEDISGLDETGIRDLLHKLDLRVSGLNAPRPVCAFAHLNLDEALMEGIRRAGFVTPTPIQAAAVPTALSGRDIIGIAKTGSGKTAAFLWPLFVHIMAQPELKFGDGPIGVICVPTRELALQIYTETNKLAKIYNLKVVCAYGGGNMWEQQKACEVGCEILVCTPGRMIDLVKKKSTNLRRTTYVVFDEADKMFNLGFEPQVRSIANHIRPDRQAMLFSATFKNRIERLARDILTDPIRIVQGEIGEANEDITQIVEVFEKVEEKWDWLTTHLVKFTTEGSVLIFVTRKAHSEEVAQRLKARDFKVLLIHGDMHQSERNTVIQAFKHQEAPILIATDVASRGLDIPSIHNVINYEIARDIDTHTHRVGRTGRAGVRGQAYTLFVASKDPADFAAHLVRHLELASQCVPPRLLQAAFKCAWFSLNRDSASGGGKNARPGIGFAPRDGQDRPTFSGPPRASPDTQTLNSSPTVGPAAVAASSAHQSDRLVAMKAAFSAQYNRRFVSAGVEASRYTHPELLGHHMAPSLGQPTPAQPQAPPLLEAPISGAQHFKVPPQPVPPVSERRSGPPEPKSRRSRWD